MADYIVREMLEKTMRDIKAGIEANMTNKHRNASGKSVRSLHYKVDGDLHAELTGNESFIWMEKGRKRGKIPSNFYKIILDWIHAKGITTWNNEKDAAWHISEFIAKNGTRLSRSGGEDIYTTVCQTAVAELYKKLDWWIDDISNQTLTYGTR